MKVLLFSFSFEWSHTRVLSIDLQVRNVENEVRFVVVVLIHRHSSQNAAKFSARRLDRFSYVLTPIYFLTRRIVSETLECRVSTFGYGNLYCVVVADQSIKIALHGALKQ